MSPARLLYHLQEIDRDLDAKRQRAASIEQEIPEAVPVRTAENVLNTARERLRQQQLDVKMQEIEVEGRRSKVKDLEHKLFGGSVTNPKELSSLQKEHEHFKENLQRLEDKLLQLLMEQEDAQKSVQQAEAELDRANKKWEETSRSLKQEQQQLSQELSLLTARRKESTRENHADDTLQLYERLRSQKGGIAVAKVERGMCQGCRVTLPSHQVQLARTSQDLVFCGSCGRILYVS